MCSDLRQRQCVSSIQYLTRDMYILKSKLSFTTTQPSPVITYYTTTKTKKENVPLDNPKNRPPPCPNSNNPTPKLLRKPPLASSLHRRGHLSNNQQGAANPTSKLQGEHLSPGRRPQGNSEIPRLANRPDGFGCAWNLGWCTGA